MGSASVFACPYSLSLSLTHTHSSCKSCGSYIKSA